VQCRPDVLPEAGGREEAHPARPLTPIRFQADADFNQIIVSAVARRYPEIDVRTATAAGLTSVDTQNRPLMDT
jgi:hypothetical protein